MKTIALNRLNILSMPKGNGLTNTQVIILLTELSKLGYRISNPEKLSTVSPTFLLDYKHLTKVLTKKRGGNVKYVPLFSNFPENIPEDKSYFLKRIMGYIGNTLNIFEDVTELDNGTKVPKWLFDVSEFGADPITQMQSTELFELATKRNKAKSSDTHTEWIDLKIIHDESLTDELQTYLQRLIYSKSSIKEELHKDIFQLINFLDIEALDSNLIVFKETKSLIMSHLWKSSKFNSVKLIANTATDLLRMFATVTGTDASLSDKIKFPKMKRPARKMILAVMENSHTLAEDVKKYQGLWLEIGRYLHPTEYAKQFPKTAEIFDALRNGKIETFNSKTEKYLAFKELAQLLDHLEMKPGVYARKLHEILRKFPNDTDQILASFKKNISKIQLKNALVLKSYFETINKATHRTIINKKGKIKVLENNAYAGLSSKTIAKVIDLIVDFIFESISKKESWSEQKVWIDSSLANYTVPLQQRKASDGILTVGRGSRIDVNFDKVLRLFVYWKERSQTTDLDLSVMQMDADFKHIGHVSYTNLSSDGIVHSGDIQSAPLGAAEFIDITLTKLDKDVKYLAVQVLKYSGSNFDEIDCHAGWMMRKQINSHVKSFDIKTVVNKFDLNGRAAYAIPLIVDVEASQIIMTDLFVGKKVFHNNVESTHGDVTFICSQIAKFIKTRPNMLELATFHAAARAAEMVAEKAEADITFGYTDCTYNAKDVETILSELI